MNLSCNDAAFIGTLLFERLTTLAQNNEKDDVDLAAEKHAWRLFETMSAETIRLAALEHEKC